ncbi:MAG: dual CXXC motif small (seleno)protein [Desulfonatronovibrio sp.]
MYCRACKKKYSVNELSQSMNEYLEESLGDIPCDRI